MLTYLLKIGVGLVLTGALSCGGALVGLFVGTVIGRAYGNIDRWDDITAVHFGVLAGGILGLVMGIATMRSLLRGE